MNLSNSQTDDWSHLGGVEGLEAAGGVDTHQAADHRLLVGDDLLLVGYGLLQGI